jgi:hypothetical protein
VVAGSTGTGLIGAVFASVTRVGLGAMLDEMGLMSAAGLGSGSTGTALASAGRTGARLGLPGVTQTGLAAASTGSGLTRAGAFGVWAAGVESVGAPVARVRVLGATSLLGEVTVGGAAGVGVCARGAVGSVGKAGVCARGATSPSSGVTARLGSADKGGGGLGGA